MRNKSRLGLVRNVINNILDNQPDKEHANCGYIHLYGVSAFCNQLAILRGFNPELASIAGLLHDVHTYRTGNSKNHAHMGAEDAKSILKNLNKFTEQEQKLITNAIYHHSSKEFINEPFDELLKDADVLQYYLVNPYRPHPIARINRLRTIFGELGLNAAVLQHLEINN